MKIKISCSAYNLRNLIFPFTKPKKEGEVMLVKIYTPAYNRPDYITLQRKTFLKFLKDDFEYIVINSATEEDNKLKINEECKQLEIRCIEMEEYDHYNPSEAHATVLYWLFHEYIKHDIDSLAVIVDFDMFLVNEFSINKFMDKYDVAAIYNCRQHIDYLQPGIMFFNMPSLPNKDDISFWCGDIEGVRVDTGGSIYYWLKSNQQLRIRNLAEHECHSDFFPAEIVDPHIEDYKFHIIEKAFLHYGRGSNWDMKSNEYHQNKMAFLDKYLKIRCETSEKENI
jgi:hypothetical protein